MPKVVLKSISDYREALQRALKLRDAGATAEMNEELAAIEAAIAAYVVKPGVPARRKGRPKGSRTDV